MSTFAFIHGAGDAGWYWHLVESRLRSRGHNTLAPDLPIEDDAAGLTNYARVVVDAIADRTDVVVVGQSLGGYVAPIVAADVSAGMIVLVAGMIPSPDESANEMFEATKWHSDARATSTIEAFYHDVPDELARQAMAHGRRQSDTPGDEPWPLAAWPEIETRFVLGLKDRFFPPAWLRGVVRDRLRLEPDEIDSGHCPALSRPDELADLLESYL